MERFYKIHSDLISSVQLPIERSLKHEINWNNRLIGIKGKRGIGKTAFLLDYIKTNFGIDKDCLYVNLNNFYFSGSNLVDFANQFRKTGGRTLVLDQVFKYPDWSVALGDIYDNYPDLQVIFTGSPVMRFKDDNPHLQGKVSSYHLQGLSFREFLNYKTNQKFSKYSLNDILKNHIQISKDILFKVKPLAYFYDYLKFGFYPFFVSDHNFYEELIKVVNLTLEIDIPFLLQMDLNFHPKLKKLIFELSKDMPHTPNISKLSKSIDTSRATVMNYLNYLRNARLINMLYTESLDYTKKPDQIYLQNTNMLFALSMTEPSAKAINETFFFNQLKKQHSVLSNGKSGEFLIDNSLIFKILENKQINNNFSNTYSVIGDEEFGVGNTIPLWLFGFLY